MEDFIDDLPVSWNSTTPVSIESVDQAGRVHSGNLSVNMQDGSDLYQDVDIKVGCYYVLSFFAHGEGQQIGLRATITFLDDQNNQLLTNQLIVREQDLINSNRSFGYFRLVSGAAPSGAVKARVAFYVVAGGGNHHSRICMFYSLMWGILGIILVNYIDPFINNILIHLNYDLLNIIALIYVLTIIYQFYNHDYKNH